MRKQYSTVSFKGQIFYVGIDVHKTQWTVAIQHCGQMSETFTMDPAPEKLAKHLKRNYPEAEYRSVYEAGFSGFEAHRTLCRLGVQLRFPCDVSEALSRWLNEHGALGGRSPAVKDLRSADFRSGSVPVRPDATSVTLV